jgi:hypothetical protein
VEVSVSIRDKAAASPLRRERFHIPEWDDVEVELRSVTVEQIRALSDGSDSDRFRDSVRVVVAGTFDPETGDPAFTQEDVPMLEGVSAGVVVRLAERILEVSGLTEDAVALGKGGS